MDELPMDDLFKLFAKITEQYIEMHQESGWSPREIAMHAIANVVRDYDYVLLNKTYYEFLTQPQEIAQ